jgi:DNA-binding MarR family transcriptional regulator
MPESVCLQPFLRDTQLTGYMPIPRALIRMDLPSTAVLIYAALLDRGTLSRKNHYTDEAGHIYVIFPVERLAELLHLSDTAVKRHLRELEDRGLIRRCREKRNSPSRIYLNLPEESIKGREEGTNCPEEGAKSTLPRVQKVPPNNRKEQQNNSNYYQYGEDESL